MVNLHFFIKFVCSFKIIKKKNKKKIFKNQKFEINKKRIGES